MTVINQQGKETKISNVLKGKLLEQKRKDIFDYFKEQVDNWIRENQDKEFLLCNLCPSIWTETPSLQAIHDMRLKEAEERKSKRSPMSQAGIDAGRFLKEFLSKDSERIFLVKKVAHKGHKANSYRLL